jgi:amino acid transporter
MFVPFLNGDWTSSNMTWGTLGDEGQAWGGLRLAIVWLWIMAWSSWGVDTCATFAPEYKDTVNDTKLALRSATLFTIAVYILLPLGLVGGVGEETVAAFDYVGALEQLTGSDALADFFVVVICASFLISMNTATADGGRALYGIARDDMTVKQLYHLNRFHVPARGMTIDMIVNLCFVFLVGNLFGILAASNIGYVLAHFFAITAFILLRRDRPDWPRPIHLGAIWVPIAYVLAVIVAIFTIVGVGWFQTSAGGYGGTKEKIIGFSVLGIAILLYLFRRIVQDKETPHWREETPKLPEQATEAVSAPVSG